MTTRKRKRTQAKHRRRPAPAVTPETYLAGIPMCIICHVQRPMRTSKGDRKVCVDCYEKRL